MTTIIYQNGSIYADSQATWPDGKIEYNTKKAFKYKDHLTSGCGNQWLMYYFAQNRTKGHKIRKFLMRHLKFFIWPCSDIDASEVESNNYFTKVIYLDNTQLIVYDLNVKSFGKFSYILAKENFRVKGSLKNKIYFSIGSGSKYAMEEMNKDEEDPYNSMEYAIKNDPSTGGIIYKVCLNR